jgi:hypothetical protein
LVEDLLSGELNIVYLEVKIHTNSLDEDLNMRFENIDRNAYISVLMVLNKKMMSTKEEGKMAD